MDLFETRKVFPSTQPFGMAALNDLLANTDSIMSYPYTPGTDRITARGEKITDLPAGGYQNHWTRNIVFNPAGTKLYVTIGFQTNVDEKGLDAKTPPAL